VSFMRDSQLAGRESPCRDNTIEGNVGVADESLHASRIAADNGFAGAAGQPAPAAFPKGFLEGFVERFPVRSRGGFIEAFAQIALPDDKHAAGGRPAVS